MILLLHNRYRTTGGEERVVDDLAWLLREHAVDDVEVLARDSATLGRARAAAALLGGGLRPEDVAAAVRRTKARVVHAHNLNPSFGWRALAAARAAGARVVLHLHNYRLVCAVGTCFTRGEDCTRCHGRNTVPGVVLRCRGSLPEALAYGASLARWQRRLTAHVDRFVVPSAFARDRLRALAAPLTAPVEVVPHPVRDIGQGSAADRGRFALVASRLAPEKAVDEAVAACVAAEVPVTVAGDGPLATELRARAPADGVTWAGRLAAAEVDRLRRDAALAVVTSRAAETFGLAAAEAMAAGVPVTATRIGALPELVPEDGLVPLGDRDALVSAIRRRFADAEAGRRGQAAVAERCAPERVAGRLADVYAAVTGD